MTILPIKMKFFILLLSYFILYTSNLSAQWHQLPGPPGGGGRAFVQSTATGFLYAATPNGVYVSKDHARSWQPKGLQGMDVSKILQFQNDASDEILFALAAGFAPANGSPVLYRSTDSGTTWIENVQGNRSLVTIVEDSANLLLADNGVDTNGSIMRSTDIGKHWTKVASAPSGVPLKDIAVSGKTLVAVAGSNVWTSSASGGAPWFPVLDTGIHSPRFLRSAAADLFLATNSGVLISTDGGTSWLHPTNTGIDRDGIIYALAVNGLTMVATTGDHTWRSTDGARTWTPFDNSAGFPSCCLTYTIDYADNRFFTGGDAGSLVSNDGSSWVYSDSGILSSWVMDVASHDTNLFAATTRGIFRSSDHGATWITPAGASGLADSLAIELTSIGSDLYASWQGLWKWNGQTWVTLLDRAVSSIARDGGVLYASLYESGVIKSTDDGKNWTLPLAIGLPVDTVKSLSIFAIPGKVFVVPVDVAGPNGWIYASTDAGNSWSQKTTLRPGAKPRGFGTVGSKLYLATSRSIMTSDDNGEHWLSDSTQGAMFLRGSGGGIVMGQSGPSSSEILTVITPTNITVPLLSSDSTSLIWDFTSDAKYAYVATQDQGIWATAISNLPLSVSPHQNVSPGALDVFPNPSSSKTTISFTLPDRAHVSLKLYDELGVMRQTYFDGEIDAGVTNLPIDLRTLPNGIYTAVLSTPIKSGVGRLIIVR